MIARNSFRLCVALLLVLAGLGAGPRAGPGPGGSAGDGGEIGADAAAVHSGGLERARSLVIVLHGGSWRRAPPSELARRAVADLSADARRAGLRLLAPEAPAVAWAGMGSDGPVPWLSDEGAARVWSLLEREIEAERADPRRIYLAGHGAGATGALLLAARQPGRVAAVAAWSGTPPPLWNEQREVVGLVEDPHEGLRDLPVYLWTAQDDEVLDRAALRCFVQGMNAAKAEGAARRAPFLHHQGAGGHGYGARGPGRGLRFLKRHVRPRR